MQEERFKVIGYCPDGFIYVYDSIYNSVHSWQVMESKATILNRYSGLTKFNHLGEVREYMERKKELEQAATEVQDSLE